ECIGAIRRASTDPREVGLPWRRSAGNDRNGTLRVVRQIAPPFLYTLAASQARGKRLKLHGWNPHRQLLTVGKCFWSGKVVAMRLPNLTASMKVGDDSKRIKRCKTSGL